MTIKKQNPHIEKKDTALGEIIKRAMAENDLSLRQLSQLCDISPSTVSRILNDKQPPNIKHLKAFSAHLNLPLAQLLNASGWNVDETVNKSSKLMLSVICEILQAHGIEMDNIVCEIEKDLKKYEKYAKTLSGRKAIESGFLSKLNGLEGEGAIIDQLSLLHKIYCNDSEPAVRCVAGSALLYLILTPDVIPDYAFPLGYLDDAIAVVLTVRKLREDFGIILETGD